MERGCSTCSIASNREVIKTEEQIVMEKISTICQKMNTTLFVAADVVNSLNILANDINKGLNRFHHYIHKVTEKLIIVPTFWILKHFFVYIAWLIKTWPVAPTLSKLSNSNPKLWSYLHSDTLSHTHRFGADDSSPEDKSTLFTARVKDELLPGIKKSFNDVAAMVCGLIEVVTWTDVLLTNLWY